MSQPFRVEGLGEVDRSRPLKFTFDGAVYEGYEGDTLASALLANGVRLVGRSYKYHRPRGFLSAGPEEPNALVGVSRGPGRFTPNLRATQIELYEGLIAVSQNRGPSLKFDIGAVNGLISPLIGAGFYYKTFMGPDLFGKNWAWKRVYEPAIRRAAGLGNAPSESDPDAYVRYFDHCDVLIVGAGPAGLAAALAASASGARVVVCDEDPAPGGALILETDARIDDNGARDWLAKTIVALCNAPDIKSASQAILRAPPGLVARRATSTRWRPSTPSIAALVATAIPAARAASGSGPVASSRRSAISSTLTPACLRSIAAR
jgi:sarcosine oxidase, subunit alpha